MSFRNKNTRLAYAILLSFFLLSILSTFFPSLIEYTIIQSLGLPILLISIINFIGLIIQNAYDICDTQDDSDTQEHEYLQNREGELYEYENKRFIKLSENIEIYKLVRERIKKYSSVIAIFDIGFLTLFVVTAILRPPFLRTDGFAIAYWSLTVLLASAYFHSSLSHRLFNSTFAKVKASRSQKTKTEEDIG